MNRKEKELADKEIELYKREQFLLRDREAYDAHVKAWIEVQSARRESSEKVAELGIQTAKLEARKEVLVELGAIKDQEIALLKELLKDAIKSLQTVKQGA